MNKTSTRLNLPPKHGCCAYLFFDGQHMVINMNMNAHCFFLTAPANT